MRHSKSGTKIPTLTSSPIISASWRRHRALTFIWLIPAHSGVYGVCCRMRQQCAYQQIHHRRALSVLQCWCQFALMSMLSNTFHRRGWTENVIITALRWVVKYLATRAREKQYHRLFGKCIHKSSACCCVDEGGETLFHSASTRSPLSSLLSHPVR